MESNSCRILLLSLRAVAARLQALAGNGVYVRLASVVGSPLFGIRDAPAVGFTKKSCCDTQPADQEVKAACQGKERPLKSGLLTKTPDFRDELCRCPRCPAGKRRHFEDCVPIYGSRRDRADNIFDRSIEIALREKSVIEETKAGRAENLVMVEKGDDPGRESPQSGAIAISVGVLDELLGRTPASVIICQNSCLHLAHRPQGWIDGVVAGDLRPKLVAKFAALFPNVARCVQIHRFVALRTHCASRLSDLSATRPFTIRSKLAWRHRSIVPKTRSQTFVVTP